MVKRVSAEELKQLQGVGGTKSRKYRNTPTAVDGIRFDSAGEARRYQDNLLRIRSGDLAMQLLQTPFHFVAGGGEIIKYVSDFIEIAPPALPYIRVVDFKGVETPEFKIKKKLIEGAFPVQIEVVRR